MNKNAGKRGEAGFTLLELTFTAGIMTVGIVMLMNSVINISHQSTVSETAVLASHFNTSVLESARDRDLDQLLTFNSDESEFDVADDGTVYIENLGKVTFEMWCVVPDDNNGIQRLSIPMTADEQAAMTNTPNPIEIQVQTSIDKGRGTGNEYKFMTSGLFYY